VVWPLQKRLRRPRLTGLHGQILEKALDLAVTCGYNNNKFSSFINRRRHNETHKKEV
jgi:hypothetical protein